MNSEFAGRSTKSGEQEKVTATAKARIQRRAEKDPDTEEVSLDEPHDKFLHGGVPEYGGRPKEGWRIR